ncbi:MAG: NINE protein [Burkholderiaceae bacterium]
MISRHKNKTLATFFASLLGAFGIHRFYIRGYKDRWAWIHLLSLPLSAIAIILFKNQPVLFTFSPLLISGLAGFIEALVIGLTPDDKWDASYNAQSNQQSHSNWPLALLLVLTVGIGAMALIATIARFFDLLYTGGAYG